MVGKTLGHYEILEPLGKGGMGEVYRARDTKLDRDVAIKVLPEDFATDPDRLARFEREAKLLASLNHANIAAIYGLEDEGDQRFIVMEVVEGEALAERISRSGRIEVDETLDIARQIAEALEAAHENGVIHRDLKPANVIVTPGHKVKVLDFGLAKHAEGAGDESDALTHSPTATVAGTAAGVLLGTAPYMSPEQAKGRVLDKRTDIWAFGCVLFEMLTGRRPFQGENVTETLAAVLKEDPDWTLLPAATPPLAASLLRRCLRKSPDRRVHDIADARIEIEEALSSPENALSVVDPQTTVQRKWARAVPWVVTIITILIASGTVMSGARRDAGTATTPQTKHVQLIPDRLIVERIARGTRPAISPDGTRIAYSRDGPGDRLLLQSLDSEETRLVPDTPGAGAISFSPDGESVAFRASGEIKKVAFAGGSPSTVAPAASAIRGLSWGADDTIYFATEAGGIYGVPAAGGNRTLVVPPDGQAGEAYVVHPEMLPGGRAMLYDVSYGGRIDDEPIFVIDLETGDRKKLIDQGSTPQYASSGHIVFARRGQLFAAPFDLDRLEVTGSPTLVGGDIYTPPLYTRAIYDLSQDGTLIYLGGESPSYSLRLVDEDGNETLATEDRDVFMHPRFSPDGSQLAVTTLGGELWVYDLDRASKTRLNFEGIKTLPVWTPNGERIAFALANRSPWNVFWGPPDNTEGILPLWESDNTTYPVSWSHDGQLLAIEDLSSDTGYDVSILRLNGSQVMKEPFLNTEFDEHGPMFSPAGPWIAYVSDETGRNEVYVEPYPPTGSRYPISSQGGGQPIWAKDGSRLFYDTGNPDSSRRIAAPRAKMVVDVWTEPEFGHSPPRIYLTGRHAAIGTPSYDVSPDGRMVVVQEDEVVWPTEFQLVFGWFEELKQRVPTGRQ